MIEMRGICRDYLVGAGTVHALRDINLTIDDGEYLSIMGPSGSGKSTLLNVIGCLDRPSAGTYRLDGRNVAALDDRAVARIRGHKIGFVFQSFHLVPRLTAAGNVELPMLLAGVEREVRSARVSQALDAVGLSGRTHHKPEQLSGGERQRVAIARAIVMGPAVLLADEPTGNLDSASGAEIVALLERMNTQGLTLIVVTHDPNIGRRAHMHLGMVDGALADQDLVRAAS